MDYQDVARFSQTWGLVFLVILFAVAVTYALWPKNKEKFDRAARMPLRDEQEEDENNDRNQ